MEELLLLFKKIYESDSFVLEKVMLLEPHSSFFQFLWNRLTKALSKETLSKVVALTSSKENLVFTQNFVKTMPYVYLESLLDHDKIPKEYGGFSTNFKHNILQYSFDDSDMSTYDNSIAQKPTIFLTSSFAYDVSNLQNLKNKIKFIESDIDDIVNIIFQ